MQYEGVERTARTPTLTLSYPNLTHVYNNNAPTIHAPAHQNNNLRGRAAVVVAWKRRPVHKCSVYWPATVDYCTTQLPPSVSPVLALLPPRFSPACPLDTV